MKAFCKRVSWCVLICMTLVSLPVVAAGKAEATNPVDQMHVVYVSPLLSHPVWLYAKKGFEDACSELGVKGDWVGPQGIAPDVMAQLVDTAVAQKADGIIVHGLAPGRPVNDAIGKGIPVLIVEGDIPDVDGSLAVLAKDIQKQGTLIYEMISKKIPANARIVYSIQCAALNHQAYVDQNNAVIKALSRHPGGAELVNITTTGGDKMKSAMEWQNTLNAYPQVNVAINLSAEGAPACAKVVDEMSKGGKVLVFGVDDIQETKDLIASGKVEGTIVCSFYNYGYQAMHWLHQHLTEGRVPVKKINDVGTIIVTKESLATYGDELKTRTDLPPRS